MEIEGEGEQLVAGARKKEGSGWQWHWQREGLGCWFDGEGGIEGLVIGCNTTVVRGGVGAANDALTGFCGSAKLFFIMVSLFEELRGILCIAHVEEDDISSHKLELLVGKLENPYGILEFVRGLKDEGNAFYKQCYMGFVLTKYSLALKLLSFFTVGNDEDKSVFSSLAVSLNLNLGACYVKEENIDKVGQLCSAVLCYDTSNVKAYFRRAVAALGLNKPELAFMDLAQAIRIDPTNREFQQKLNEVISLLGWSLDFVNEAVANTREDKMFRDYAKIGKEEEKRKLGKKGKRKERDGSGDGCVRRCIGVKDVTKKETDVAGKIFEFGGG
uniref:Uncharacterized protein n=1 Tax=Chenopodium quinoa TaxID=63459 RepID=A0A803N984_CHEQI